MHTAIFLLVLTTFCGRSNGDWRPVGQGDPLIDPTHVYSPPLVQHVHYWLKSPSLSLEPPPSKVSELSQVAGWPQITSHYQTNPTTLISITTSKPETTEHFRLNYVQTLKPEYISITTPPTTTTTTTTTTQPTTQTTTTTTSTTTVPPPPPLSFVIQGHSKVKKYGPNPESINSIHSINHNHLTSTKVIS